MMKATVAKAITNDVNEARKSEKELKNITFCETVVTEAISNASRMGDDSVNVVVEEGYSVNAIADYIQKNGYEVNVFYGYKISVIKIDW